MEELQPEDLEKLVQELEGKSEEKETLSPEVEELLRDLQQSHAWLTRLEAAERLGELSESNPRIVQSLVTAGESDSLPSVREAAVESLRAPVHQRVLEQHPDLKEATERALELGPGADKQRPPSDKISMLMGEEVVDSFLSRVFHDPRWKWAPIYGLFLTLTAVLVFAESSLWTLLAAGVVWFAGSVLGLIILWSKGHSVGGGVLRIIDLGDDSLGCLLVLLALLALAGPVILLVALLIKPRGSAAGVSRQRAAAQAAGRRKSAPVHGDGPSECPACGACVEAGSKACGECGVALEGAAV